MNKNKRYLCYAMLIAMPILFLLLLLMLINPLLMLLALLVVIILTGLLYRSRPDLFPWLGKKAPVEVKPVAGPQGPISHSDENRTYLQLSSVNASSSNCISMNRPVFIIGRAADCQYIINDSMVSNHHLLLEYDSSDNLCYATDKSTNGTFLNGMPMKRNTRYALKQGDTLKIVSNAYRVEYVYY